MAKDTVNKLNSFKECINSNNSHIDAKCNKFIECMMHNPNSKLSIANCIKTVQPSANCIKIVKKCGEQIKSQYAAEKEPIKVSAGQPSRNLHFFDWQRRIMPISKYKYGNNFTPPTLKKKNDYLPGTDIYPSIYRHHIELSDAVDIYDDTTAEAHATNDRICIYAGSILYTIFVAIFIYKHFKLK